MDELKNNLAQIYPSSVVRKNPTETLKDVVIRKGQRSTLVKIMFVRALTSTSID